MKFHFLFTVFCCIENHLNVNYHNVVVLLRTVFNFIVNYNYAYHNIYIHDSCTHDHFLLCSVNVEVDWICFFFSFSFNSFVFTYEFFYDSSFWINFDLCCDWVTKWLDFRVNSYNFLSKDYVYSDSNFFVSSLNSYIFYRF